MKRIVKPLICVLLSAALLSSLAACGSTSAVNEASLGDPYGNSGDGLLAYDPGTEAAETDTGLPGLLSIENENTETPEESTEETAEENETATAAAEEPETETETETETEEPDPLEQVDMTADHPFYIKVNRAANTVTVYGCDADGNYSIPVRAFVCSVGLDNATPTGTFNIYERYDWKDLYGNTYGQYAVRFYGHILFHSVPYLSPDKDQLEYEEFNKLGQAASQGCVRMTVADVKWIYDNCNDGTVVEIYDDEDNPGPLGKPEAPKIDTSSPNRGWDPTDPDPENPWNSDK